MSPPSRCTSKNTSKLAFFCVLGILSLVHTGCLRWLHPVRPLDLHECLTLPKGCNRHVYIFFVHGLDPLDFCNLKGVCRYCQDLGYTQTYYGQLYHVPRFVKEIRRIHECDPFARFVLVGFSAGANQVRNMANRLGQEGITIDLLVYMGGNTLKNEPRSRPANALRILHILGTGYIWKGEPISGVENIHHPDAWHFGTPTHRGTLQRLAQELAVVACRVPVGPAVPHEELPLPKTTSRKISNGWDFLRPALSLDVPRSTTDGQARAGGDSVPERVTALSRQ